MVRRSAANQLARGRTLSDEGWKVGSGRCAGWNAIECRTTAWRFNREIDDADCGTLHGAARGGVQRGAEAAGRVANSAVIGLRHRTRLVDAPGIGFVRWPCGDADRVVVRIVRQRQRYDPPCDQDERRKPSTDVTMTQELRVQAMPD